jgi:large subunit ribosomal protein L25
LPRFLPEYLELDVSKMELNDILHLSDIKLPEGVTSVALEHGTDLPVVAVNPPRREEAETVDEEAEVPASDVPAAKGTDAEDEKS